MRAMVFEEVGAPLRAVERPIPEPAPTARSCSRSRVPVRTQVSAYALEDLRAGRFTGAAVLVP
jgi:hypothetical protein